MKVTSKGSSSPVSGSSRTGSAAGAAGGPSFASHLQGPGSAAPTAAAGVDSPLALGGIEALLALQASGDALEDKKRRALIQHGEDLLDMLEALRGDLLAGLVPQERLLALARLLRGRREPVADPRLVGLIDEIELRAEVELAKLTRDFDTSNSAAIP